MSLSCKGFYNANVGNVLLNGGVESVDLGLHLCESGHSAEDKKCHRGEKQGKGHRHNYRKLGAELYRHNDTAYKHTGGAEHHAEHHVDEVLKLCYVVCKSGYKRAGRDFVDIGKAEALYLSEKVCSEVGGEVDRSLRAEIRAANAAQHHKKGSAYHHSHYDKALLGGESACVRSVDNLAEEERPQNLPQHLEYHTKRA